MLSQQVLGVLSKRGIMHGYMSALLKQFWSALYEICEVPRTSR